MGLFSPKKATPVSSLKNTTPQRSKSVSNLSQLNTVSARVDNSVPSTSKVTVPQNEFAITNSKCANPSNIFETLTKINSVQCDTNNMNTNSVQCDTNNMSDEIKKSENNANENTLVQTGLERYITVTNKRKRDPKSPQEIADRMKTAKINAVETDNRFQVLVDDNDQNSKNENGVSKERPPSIYLREAPSNELVKLLNDQTKGDFFIALIKRGNIAETRIQAKSIEAYRKIVATLEDKNKFFYTFRLKSAKGVTVVIKGIESNVKPTEISEELAKKGFQIKNVINIFNRDKKPQPMFRVELEPELTKTVGIHPIYHLKYLLYRRIVVEEPHKRKTVLQCTNCQEFGHSKNYCKLPAVCVICGKLHTTKQCQLDKSKPELKTCSNCGENHTANYRGCVVYKELRKKLTPRQRVEQQVLNQIFKTQNNAKEIPQPDTVQIHPNVTYAEAAKIQINNQPPNEAEGIYKVISTLNDSMNKFMQMMETNMNLMLQNMNTLMQLLIQNQPKPINE